MEWLDQNVEDESSGMVPAPGSDDQESISIVDPDDLGGFCESTGASDESDLGAPRMREVVFLRDDEDDDYLDDDDDDEDDEDDEDDDLDDDDDF